MSYNKLTPAILQQLKAIVGDSNVLVDTDNLKNYGHDNKCTIIMKRRSFVQSGSLAVTFSAFTPLLNMINPATYQMKLLRRNVGIFNEKGGTIGWLIQPDGIVVIDTQWKEQSQHLLEEIQKQQSGPVDLLINTHHHGDHTSGNIAYKGIAKHSLVAHSLDRLHPVRWLNCLF